MKIIKSLSIAAVIGIVGSLMAGCYVEDRPHPVYVVRHRPAVVYVVR